MKLPIHQLDVFASARFRGNPAAVVVLSDWLPDPMLQGIAEENNLSETAFVVPGDAVFALRWFTPTVEVDLCGHATLAAAAVVFELGYATGPEVVFRYPGGTVRVTRRGDLLALDFPAWPPTPRDVDASVAGALGAMPSAVHASRDLLAVFDGEVDVARLRPDLDAIASLDTFAVIASAPGEASDYVLRFFAPGAGVPEDPATGSAQCTLVPYWAARLGRAAVHGLQLSRRGGEFFCEHKGERVEIAGRVVPYLRGEIEV